MHFLFQGIVVKVITKALGDKYHNEKGHIVSLVDKFTAIVQMLNSKAKIKFDQSHLETVIPAVGMWLHSAAEQNVRATNTEDTNANIFNRSSSKSREWSLPWKHRNSKGSKDEQVLRNNCN